MGNTLPANKKVTTVWLEPSTREKKLFFCPNCKVPLIEYVGHVVTIVPGNSPYEPRTILKCKGSVRKRDGQWQECGYQYSFMSAVFAKE